jgi:type IV pilus assembly protein PilB
MPLREDDKRFFVATSDPSNPLVEDDVAFATGRTPQFEIAPPGAIQDALAEYYGGPPELPALELRDELTRAVEVLQESGPEKVEASEVESAPIIKLTNFILSDAVRQRASDIHMEPGRGEGAVRIRVDGVMRTLLRLSMPAMNRVVTRIKIMGRIDIADRLRPQDGRARIQIESKPLDLRISTVPSRDAEKCVVRLLDHSTAPTLSDLGLPEATLARIRKLLDHRSGIVVVTGPTGSGKTTTLYAAIRELANGSVNVMTVEDPVEYEIAGINQIQVEPKQKVTFASALRAILRQDPDVILVGEIRDQETAGIALQASMTGHLVLATLHTNDAATAVERLFDLGLDRTGIATSLRGVIAQRLVRCLCNACARPRSGALEGEAKTLSERYGVRPVRQPAGCPECGHTGYRGRIPVFEVLVAGRSLAAMVSEGKPAADIAREAVAHHMQPMLEAGLARVASGETTLEEVARVLGGEDDRSEKETQPAAVPAILVVDDDAVQRSVARHVLEAAGFRVDDVADGEQALARIRSGPPCGLVVLDFTMPGLDGLEVLTQLRTSPATAALPVVVVTAKEDDALEARLIDAGADDYVRKPFAASRFVARVKAALRRAKLNPDASRGPREGT